ncbi:unnamed protein product [Caenorhabditis angaria]|uniref:Uncharacterized protein n=1 Tax=Caenorhabditis angaria TaxID=860376 RepID=A0A9P1ILY3_9PELO|nr:unnamed protein product [Caenorhabditis angaria]
MRCSELKRAVEDVVLRPDENRLAELQKRGTIAALDLCQIESSNSSRTNDEMITASAMNGCSCSSEIVGASTSTSSSTTTTTDTRPAPPLCASSSLDAIMCRPQPSLLHRHSASGSRRQSRVFSNFQSKRKRSNSLTNYNKGQTTLSVSLPPSARHTPNRFVSEEEAFRSSIASSDSHSSVAEYTNGFVLEEEEASASSIINPPPPPPPSLHHSNHSSTSSSSNPFTTYRQPKDDYDEDMMDCD